MGRNGMNGFIWLLVALAPILFAAGYYLHTLRVRVRERQEKASCRALGHILDASCLCSRCRLPLHEYQLISTNERCVGRGLANPRADPGALYLDGDFQPDHDYGLIQSLYEIEQRYRCARCGDEMTIKTQKNVADER